MNRFIVFKRECIYICMNNDIFICKLGIVCIYDVFFV